MFSHWKMGRIFTIDEGEISVWMSLSQNSKLLLQILYSGLSIELMILKNNPETLIDVEIILVLGRTR